MLLSFITEVPLRLWCIQNAKPFLTLGNFQEYLDDDVVVPTMWNARERSVAVIDKEAVHKLVKIIGEVNIGVYEKWGSPSVGNTCSTFRCTPGVMLRVYPGFMRKYGKLTPKGLFIPVYQII